MRLGARVSVLDEGDGPAQQAAAAALIELGAQVRLGAGATFPEDADLLVLSPGFGPDSPLPRAAQAAGVPVWGDIELAWAFRQEAIAAGRTPAAWLCLTGTNGKTTTVRMLESILRAAGLRAVAAGNVGLPLLEAVLADDPPYDVLAIELSSFQLHYVSSVAPEAAALLNVASDHLDWHGGLDAYASDKGRVFRGARRACVVNAADIITEHLVEMAQVHGEVDPSCPTVSFTLEAPGPRQLGVREGVLVDRAFGADAGAPPSDGGAEGVVLGQVSDVAPTGAHNVENALAAAALARAYGVPAAAVAAGLRAFHPDPHRIAEIATVEGVTYVDDSKATNPHAAAASLRTYSEVVWIAGGLAKGAMFDDLVVGARERLRGAVLLGRDRFIVADALARHAPEVPVIEVDSGDPGAMDEVVRAATGLATRGSTVLLAPACASMDMFGNYGERGDAFAAAVHRLPGASLPGQS